MNETRRRVTEGRTEGRTEGTGRGGERGGKDLYKEDKENEENPAGKEEYVKQQELKQEE